MFAEQTPTLRDILPLLPELWLLLWGLVVLGLDSIRPHRKKPALPYVTLFGLACGLGLVIFLWATGCDRVVFGVLNCDRFALAIKAIGLLTTGLVILVSEPFMRSRSDHLGTYYALLIFATLPISLLAGATDLVLLYLSLEFLSLIFYLLTGYSKQEPRAAEAALKFLIYGATLSAIMLYGLSWLFGLTGTTELVGMAATLGGPGGTDRPAVAVIALLLVAAGFAFKIGAVPFHWWAPDVYQGAPTPITAFVSVAPKTAGIAVILRVLHTALPLGELPNLAQDWQTLFIALSIVTMTAGNLIGLWQTNVKRLMAYSSVAQVGYLLIGVVSPLQPAGARATLFHLTVYALANLGIFAAIIAFSNQTGSDEIEDYAGLHARAPGMALALLICLLSLTGIPPTAGFVGKLLLFTSILKMEPGQSLVFLAVIGVINSVISFGCYWRIIRAIYLLPPGEDKERSSVNITPALSVALGLAVASVAAAGLFPGPLMDLLQTAARTLFAGS